MFRTHPDAEVVALRALVVEARQQVQRAGGGVDAELRGRGRLQDLVGALAVGGRVGVVQYCNYHVDGSHRQVVKVARLIVERRGRGEQAGGRVEAEKALAPLQREPGRAGTAHLQRRQRRARRLVLEDFARDVRGQEAGRRVDGVDDEHVQRQRGGARGRAGVGGAHGQRVLARAGGRQRARQAHVAQRRVHAERAGRVARRQRVQHARRVARVAVGGAQRGHQRARGSVARQPRLGQAPPPLGRVLVGVVDAHDDARVGPRRARSLVAGPHRQLVHGRALPAGTFTGT
ncbi:hypothetical protein HW555_013678 [Spodoptera exigua]|uniref:Uncharacterized protein n=1 Tax=Spodoptera exigua TaxID=7107 RepID=A0A835G2F7_SPOEX|nr:hypothetical protein HW555_013678 [Spodoptera exigua]